MLQLFLLILSLYHIYQINRSEYAQDWLFNLNIANMFLVLLKYHSRNMSQVEKELKQQSCIWIDLFGTVAFVPTYAFEMTRPILVFPLWACLPWPLPQAPMHCNGPIIECADNPVVMLQPYRDQLYPTFLRYSLLLYNRDSCQKFCANLKAS